MQEAGGCNFFLWMDDEFGGRAKDVIEELKKKISCLEEKQLKTEERLAKKREKMKMLKIQNSVQFNIIMALIVSLIAIIVMIYVNREMSSIRRNYLY